MDFASTLSAIRSMSIEDRIRLAEAIWNDIAAEEACPDLTEAQKQELERRLSDDEANPNDVTPWETIKAEARAKAQR